ncbi:hypothetical protein SSX86_030133 [Deinandra increscens subsp. villosa]|uniref:Integrase catalytic domain-containing protein n=1 Tax=Deinandra increscens subsp. villosa TaxID=3103831 RepID=A0AAP0CHU3_9ASTR
MLQKEQNVVTPNSKTFTDLKSSGKQTQEHDGSGFPSLKRFVLLKRRQMKEDEQQNKENEEKRHDQQRDEELLQYWTNQGSQKEYDCDKDNRVPEKRNVEKSYTVKDIIVPYMPQSMKSHSKFSLWISEATFPKKLKLPTVVRKYSGLADPDDHIFEFYSAARLEQWSEEIWCHMFVQTFTGVPRVCFDSLPAGQIDSFEDLKNKFLRQFSQQKRCMKDPAEQGHLFEGKNACAYLTGNDARSGQMRSGSGSFGRGNAGPVRGVGSVPQNKSVRGFVPKSKNFGGSSSNAGVDYRGARFVELVKTPTQILATEKVDLPAPPKMRNAPTRNLDKYCEYHKDRGHTTDTCWTLKRELDKAVKSGKLAHLVKVIRNNVQGDALVINMVQLSLTDQHRNVRSKSNSQVDWKYKEITFPPILEQMATVEPVVISAKIGGFMVKRIHIDCGSATEIIYSIPDDWVLMRTPRYENFYVLNMQKPLKTEVACLLSKTAENHAQLWHKRLGHMNLKNLNWLARGGLVKDLPIKKFMLKEKCVACAKGKQHKRLHKPKVFNRISSVLEPLHMDLFGPVSMLSLNRCASCLVITNDFSSFTWVLFLPRKSDVARILIAFIKLIENKLNLKVKSIISDNGTEFKSRTIDEFCSEKGIEHQYSAPYTPQHNGVAERRNRTLIEAASTMLCDFKLPTMFWAEAVNTACYVQNRVLINK